jgi:hypothetical protein
VIRGEARNPPPPGVVVGALGGSRLPRDLAGSPLTFHGWLADTCGDAPPWGLEGSKEGDAPPASALRRHAEHPCGYVVYFAQRGLTGRGQTPLRRMATAELLCWEAATGMLDMKCDRSDANAGRWVTGSPEGARGRYPFPCLSGCGRGRAEVRQAPWFGADSRAGGGYGYAC